MQTTLGMSSNDDKFNRIMADILKDIDISEFMKKYDDFIDEGMIKRGASRLMEYVKEKNNEHYKPILSIYDNNFCVSYQERETPLMQKYRDKVPSKTYYDASTSKYRGVSLDEYETTIENAKAFGFIKDFLEVYQYGDRSKGMWLHGNFGIGKTYLMGAMATELGKRQVGVNFVSASQLVNDLYMIMRQNSLDNSVQKQIEYLQKSEVLIIDDLGTEKITHNNVVDVFYTIFKYRGEHHKPTFVTSNFTKDQYYMMLRDSEKLDRIEIARFKEQVDVLMSEAQMNGRNRRDKA